MASLTESNKVALAHLRHKYAWPRLRPNFFPVEWSLDGGGRWLVAEKIRRKKLPLVLEIGSFLGGSTQNWLAASSTVTVIAVDPWPRWWDVAEHARKNAKSESIAKQLERPDGLYLTFLTNLWEHRDRVIPVREYAPSGLHALSDMGLRPDLIYLTADKVGDEIDLCHELFPGAIMTGDDWGWGTEKNRLPIREPVHQFCASKGRFLKVEGATWVIDTEPPSISFRLRTMRRALKKKLRDRRAA